MLVRPEDLRVAVRPRGDWEAVDLGLAMVREWRRPVYRAWLCSFGPALIVALPLAAVWPWLPVLVLWWLKPLFDRIVLQVLSRAIFGVEAGWRDVPGAIAAALRSGLAAALTVGRIGTDRAYVLPARQLEGLTGGERRRRAAALVKSARRMPHTVNEACLAIEVILAAAIVFTALWLVPQPMAAEARLLAQVWDAPAWLAVLTALGYALATSVVEPLHVGANFALYLNHRTLLEGWDIQLALQRLDAAPAAPARHAA